MPRKFKLNTKPTPLASKSKNDLVSLSISPISKYSLSVVALGLLPLAPVTTHTLLVKSVFNTFYSNYYSPLLFILSNISQTPSIYIIPRALSYKPYPGLTVPVFSPHKCLPWSGLT